ncbi:MAG: hypothetical protein AAFQ36_13630 [Pseudomonadota bacterium]
MSGDGQRRFGGSRYLYEPFDAASARVETLEQVLIARWEALEQRLVSLETKIDTMERRMWMAVYALASVIVAEIVFAVLPGTP